jgi:hypothetical protein
MDGFLDAQDVATIETEVETGAAPSAYAARDALVALMQTRPVPEGADLPAQQVTDLLQGPRRKAASHIVPTLTGRMVKVAGRAERPARDPVVEWEAGDFDAPPGNDVVLQAAGGRLHRRGPVRSGKVVGARVYGTGKATKARIFSSQGRFPASAKILLRRDGTVGDAAKDDAGTGDVVSDADVHGLIASGRAVIVTGEYGAMLPFPSRIAAASGGDGLASVARDLERVGLSLDDMDDLDWGHVSKALLKAVPPEAEVPAAGSERAQPRRESAYSYEVAPIEPTSVRKSLAAPGSDPDGTPTDWPSLLVTGPDGRPPSIGNIRKARKERAVSDAIHAARDAANFKAVDEEDVARRLKCHALPEAAIRGPPAGRPGPEEGVAGTDEDDDVVSIDGDALSEDEAVVPEAVAGESSVADMAKALGFFTSRADDRRIAAELPERSGAASEAMTTADLAYSLVRHMVVKSALEGRLALTRLDPRHTALFSTASPVDASGPSVTTYAVAVADDAGEGSSVGPLVRARVRDGLAKDREFAIAAGTLGELASPQRTDSFWIGFRPSQTRGAPAPPPAPEPTTNVRRPPPRPQRQMPVVGGPPKIVVSDNLEVFAAPRPAEPKDVRATRRVIPGAPQGFGNTIEDLKRVVGRSAPPFVAALSADPLSRNHTACFRNQKKVIEAILAARKEGSTERVRAPERVRLDEPEAAIAAKVDDFLSRLHDRGGEALVAAFCAADAAIAAGDVRVQPSNQSMEWSDVAHAADFEEKEVDEERDVFRDVPLDDDLE